MAGIGRARLPHSCDVLGPIADRSASIRRAWPAMGRERTARRGQLCDTVRHAGCGSCAAGKASTSGDRISDHPLGLALEGDGIASLVFDDVLWPWERVFRIGRWSTSSTPPPPRWNTRPAHSAHSGAVQEHRQGSVVLGVGLLLMNASVGNARI